MAKIVVAMYDHFDAAQRAVKALADKGFPRDNISMVANDASGELKHFSEESSDVMADVAEGAGMGAAIGGLSGLLVGLASLAIPGVGPVLAAGPIATAIGGAGIGMAAGGLISGLTGMGVPDEHAGNFSEGVRRGGTLVTVHTTDEMADRAVEILDHHTPVDMDERTQLWRAEGWRRFDESAQPHTTEEIERERLRQMPMQDEMPMRMAESQEDMDRANEIREYEVYESQFRSHYETNFTDSHYLYDEYVPAYRYGYELATSDRYRDRDWNEINSEARRDWEQSHPESLWDDFKEAVREGWATVTGRR